MLLVLHLYAFSDVDDNVVPVSPVEVGLYACVRSTFEDPEISGALFGEGWG